LDELVGLVETGLGRAARFIVGPPPTFTGLVEHDLAKTSVQQNAEFTSARAAGRCTGPQWMIVARARAG